KSARFANTPSAAVQHDETPDGRAFFADRRRWGRIRHECYTRATLARRFGRFLRKSIVQSTPPHVTADAAARLMLVAHPLAWGLTWPAMKIALSEIPPFSMRVGTSGLA